MTDSTLKLPQSLKIDVLDQCKPLLDEALAGGQSVAIDGGEVASIDYSGVQLMLAFVAELRSRGLSLSWEQTSEPLRAAAADLSAEHFLEL